MARWGNKAKWLLQGTQIRLFRPACRKTSRIAQEEELLANLYINFFDDSGSRHFVTWILIYTTTFFSNLLQGLSAWHSQPPKLNREKPKAENYILWRLLWINAVSAAKIYQEPIKNTTVAISIITKKKLKWTKWKSIKIYKTDFPSLFLLL